MTIYRILLYKNVTKKTIIGTKEELSLCLSRSERYAVRYHDPPDIIAGEGFTNRLRKGDHTDLHTSLGSLPIVIVDHGAPGAPALVELRPCGIEMIGDLLI